MKLGIDLSFLTTFVNDPGSTFFFGKGLKSLFELSQFSFTVRL